MDKENHMCIHNGVLFTHKKNEILLYAATWIEVDGGYYVK
jgi:hypothetical protein